MGLVGESHQWFQRSQGKLPCSLKFHDIILGAGLHTSICNSVWGSGTYIHSWGGSMHLWCIYCFVSYTDRDGLLMFNISLFSIYALSLIFNVIMNLSLIKFNIIYIGIPCHWRGSAHLASTYYNPYLFGLHIGFSVKPFNHPLSADAFDHVEPFGTSDSPCAAGAGLGGPTSRYCFVVCHSIARSDLPGVIRAKEEKKPATWTKVHQDSWALPLSTKWRRLWDQCRLFVSSQGDFRRRAIWGFQPMIFGLVMDTVSSLRVVVFHVIQRIEHTNRKKLQHSVNTLIWWYFLTRQSAKTYHHQW